MVERPGVEPGLAVLQTAVQTHYTISRKNNLRSRESNSALELMRLGVSPDTPRSADQSRNLETKISTSNAEKQLVESHGFEP